MSSFTSGYSEPKVQQIKEEPFEELYVQEPFVEAPNDSIERNELERCCLCPDGLRLQQILLDHIKESHCIEGNLQHYQQVHL